MFWNQEINDLFNTKKLVYTKNESRDNQYFFEITGEPEDLYTFQTYFLNEYHPSAYMSKVSIKDNKLSGSRFLTAD